MEDHHPGELRRRPSPLVAVALAAARGDVRHCTHCGAAATRETSRGTLDRLCDACHAAYDAACGRLGAGDHWRELPYAAPLRAALAACVAPANAQAARPGRGVHRWVGAATREGEAVEFAVTATVGGGAGTSGGRPHDHAAAEGLGVSAACEVPGDAADVCGAAAAGRAAAWWCACAGASLSGLRPAPGGAP